MSLVATVARARAALNFPQAAPGKLWGRGASEITPRLYLSDLWTACNPEEMERLGITHIVSIFIADRGDANILAHLEESTKFIKDALDESEDNKVLVHCQQGISRSATVVCAYICATQGMEAVDAIEFVQARRSIVCPNAGFRLQLVRYSVPFVKERRKTKTASVSSDIASRIRSLFPDKATKATRRTKTVVVAEEAVPGEIAVAALVDEAVDRAFASSQ
ncbi:hypothetical protein NMY22_g807 [Coprinellus aureogranulatus]|nr:hypothetical protein NMY22_g807 [Coprinellus aureogranulatus]